MRKDSRRKLVIMDMSKDDLTTIWQEFKDTHNAKAREKLIEHYIPLVQYLVGRVAIHLPDNVDTHDLLSYGIFGLMDAIDKYDLGRDIKFETYASTRIRGAIIDGLRSTDWIPRSVRSRAREVNKVTRELENKLGRSPSDQEVAVALDMSLPKYYETLEQIRTLNLLSLDDTINTGSDSEPIRLIDTITDENSQVDSDLLESELMEELARAVDELPERERLVISLYYHDGLTLKEIGHVLEVSESRVCQIHAKAINFLRSRLKWLWND